MCLAMPLGDMERESEAEKKKGWREEGAPEGEKETQLSSNGITED